MLIILKQHCSVVRLHHVILFARSEPSFVFADVIREGQNSPDGDDDKIYYFFTEVSVEYEFFGKLLIPRIARVCKVRAAILSLNLNLNLTQLWLTQDICHFSLTPVFTRSIYLFPMKARKWICSAWLGFFPLKLPPLSPLMEVSISLSYQIWWSHFLFFILALSVNILFSVSLFTTRESTFDHVIFVT